LGEVACGSPTYEEEFVEAYLQFPKELLGHGEFFLLRAKGTSMIEAGISPGDLVVIQKQRTAKRGQIAVVLVDGEVTLKRIYPEPEHKRIRLHPENSEMEDIFVREADIQGVAVRVWKELQ
jgi:repressor LexA